MYMKNFNKSEQIGFFELMALVSLIFSIAGFILGIIAVVKNGKSKKRIYNSDMEYYNLDDNYDFSLSEIGENDGNYSDDEDELSF